MINERWVKINWQTLEVEFIIIVEIIFNNVETHKLKSLSWKFLLKTEHELIYSAKKFDLGTYVINFTNLC